jgi:sigma-B regulation protein RsbU (phosphoserine phosphatase)
LTVNAPVVFQYQQALDAFRREGASSSLLKRMSELISLLDLTTTLSSSLSGAEILDTALLIVMGELQATRGALFVRNEGECYRVQASRGLGAGAPAQADLSPITGPDVVFRGPGPLESVFEEFGLEALCPIVKADRSIAVLGLGPRADGRPFGSEDAAFLQTVAACAATPIENGLIYHELKRVNQRLSVKVFQLHNLFDLSRELTSSFDEQAIEALVATTLMGHLMVSRCALYLGADGPLALAHARGVRPEELPAAIPSEAAAPVLEALRSPLAVGELPAGKLRDRMASARMALLVPLSAGGEAQGFLAVGERVSGLPFSEEDREYALTLGRQAVAALESVRLHRLHLAQQRRDREMQIAREIQQSLFPRSRPEVPGFEVAALSEACQEVGGDHYDFIPLESGRLALAVADVSGKGAPASILMASVHASLRAMAGASPPPELMARLNRFLVASTQEHKYATLFYAELEPATGRLVYVNGGHVPPCRVGADGRCERLMAGGPALGLIEDAKYEAGEVFLQPGDVVAVVTDGVTEATSDEDREFGEEGVLRVLRARGAAGAEAVLDALVRAVHAWTGSRGCADDLTALVLTALAPHPGPL